MARALDSPGRKADFERMNREEVLASASAMAQLSIGEKLQAGIRLNHVAFEFAETISFRSNDDRA
ncbi:MAG: hypothetical protein WCJ63_05895 [Actinomycetes bacterium]